MSQFISTEHANEAFRDSLNEYNKIREKIKNIKSKNIVDISKEEVEWLCSELNHYLNSEESSWFDHS